ncbi:MAG: penicillin-binding protein 2 [Acidimicrobiia bacterium]
MIGDSPRLRLAVLGIVVLSLFAALFARLWYLQVMATDEFQVAARTNALRVVPIEAPRGRILDRNGKVLVDNRISIQVTVDRSALGELDRDERAAVLQHLADELSRSGKPSTVETLEERLADQRYSPYAPVPVAADVPESLKIYIDEHGDELHAVAAERVPVRSYPYGSLAAHILGYTGKITKEEYDERRGSEKRYELNDDIGKYGVERAYEEDLRGTPGSRRIEVDANGDPIRVVSEEPPQPGNDLVLNVDIDLQALAAQALQTGLVQARDRPPVGDDVQSTGSSGSVVVIEPGTGAVLAMASYPTFNPADFVDGISEGEWAFLNDPSGGYPLNNWALQGQYAPGSTFKPFTAYAALRAGLITPETTIQDPGYYDVPNCRGERCTFNNDGRKPNGSVDLRKSLTVSSDVYYYGLGARFWIEQDSRGGPEAMPDLLKDWGFNARTGVDLSGEQPGRIPSPSWLKSYCSQVQCLDDSWYTGNNVNMAIGQGDVLVTPLQLANGYATLANGGSVLVPHVVKEVRQGRSTEVARTIDPVQRAQIEMPPEWHQALVDGLVGVATHGTAAGAFSGFPTSSYPIAAKTGTAQVAKKAPTAVFGAFGPTTAPQYAVGVLMSESGYGGSAAAPVARRLFDVLSGVEELQPAPPDGKLDLTGTLSPPTGDVRDR